MNTNKIEVDEQYAKQYAKLKALLDYQQALVQEFEVQYLKFGAEKEKQKRIDTLRYYERNRRASFKRIRKNHLQLLLIPDLPDIYLSSYKALEGTNEDFKKSLLKHASINSLDLEVIKDDEDLSDVEEEKMEKLPKHPNNPDPHDIIASTSNIGDIKPKSSSLFPGNGRTRPDNYSATNPVSIAVTGEQQSNNPVMTGNEGEIQNVPTSSGNSIRPDQADLPKMRNQIESTHSDTFLLNKNNLQAKIHGSKNLSQIDDNNMEARRLLQHNTSNAFENVPKTEASISDAMKAIMNLVSQQTQLMQTQITEITERSGLKPQKLIIPTFSGDILQFKAFKNVFMKAVSNTDWGDLEKLLLLRSKLSDQALERVQHLSVEKQNYTITWSILDEEYLVPRSLLQHNLIKLLEITPPRYEDVSSMRAFYTTLNTVARNLEELEDVTPEEWLFELAYLKVDETIQYRFESYIRAKNLRANIKSITEFLRADCNSLETRRNNKAGEFV